MREAQKINVRLNQWPRARTTQESMVPSIKIDDTNYEIDSLSDEAKAQLQMLQATDQEIARLQTRLAIAQTARNAYANALQGLLPKADATAPGHERGAD